MERKNNTYIALLRGINVGGNNIVKMAELKACFEDLGFTDVATYIQSGNVVFSTKEKNQEALTHTIEQGLAKTFNTTIRVVTISHQQLKRAVTTAPRGFGSDPTHYRYDVIFLKEPLTSDQAIKNITLKEGVDQVSAGKGVLYFSRLIEKAAQSRLSRIVALPMYQQMTIRNWNTTTKLLALVEE